MAASVVSDQGHEMIDTNVDAPLDSSAGRRTRADDTAGAPGPASGRRKRGGT